jgi:hypothetical protein
LTKEENRIFGDAIILINATVNNEKSIQYNWLKMSQFQENLI